MGHISIEGLTQLKGLVTSIDCDDKEHELPFCKGCIYGKQHRQPFEKKDAKRATETLGIIHTDVCGPMKTESISGAKYFLMFIDDKTRKTFVYFLRSKDQVFTKFEEFKALVENEMGKHIKILRSDNGGEYINKHFNTYLKAKGIHHQTTIPYTPQQNGVAERANHTIVERARSMLHDKELTYEYWAEAVATAIYLKNRSPTTALQNITPKEAWSRMKPTVKHLRTFRCKAYAHVPDERRTKLEPKSVECIFMGYDGNSKAYRLFDPKKRTIIKSRDVRFDEEEMKPTHTIEPTCQTDCEEDPNDSEDERNGEAQTDGDTVVVEIKQPRRSRRESRPPTRYGEEFTVARIAVSDYDEPQDLQEVLARPDAKQWEQAAQMEYDSILEN
jgi:transposase InsO family protein